jgi:hypothetical protein
MQILSFNHYILLMISGIIYFKRKIIQIIKIQYISLKNFLKIYSRENKNIELLITNN